MRRTGLTESGNQARRINNNRSIAQHVIDTSLYIEDAPKCRRLHRSVKASTAFRLGLLVVEPGQDFYQVRSGKFENRAYVVAWNKDRDGWQCSCGAGCKAHAHITEVNNWIAEHIRKSA